MSPYTGNRKWKGEVGLCCLTGFFLLLAALCLAVYPGVRFSGYLSLCLAGLCLVFLAVGRWAESSRTGGIVRRVLLILLAAGLLVFAAVEGLLLAKGHQENDALPADAVLVLGAGVNGETPSLILRSRINRAADYLRAHPETPAILSGGQGAGEEISEAECMRRELVKRGIPESQLHLEEESTSTVENFTYSRRLLPELGLDAKTATLAVITSDFHCFRAHLIAQRAGLAVFDIPARTDWVLLNANYYVREFFALGKTLLFD